MNKSIKPFCLIKPVNVNNSLGTFLKTFDLTHFLPYKIVKKSKSVVLNCNSTIVQNIYFKTFHYKKTQSANLIFFFILKMNNHFIITHSDLKTFCFIKPVNVNHFLETFLNNLTYFIFPQKFIMYQILDSIRR